MALKQANRFLIIETVLGNPAGEDEDDNLVLIQLRGAEGISFPYAYDLTLIGPKNGRPPPSRLIGSRVRFGIKHVINEGDDDTFEHVQRHGVIEAFSEIGPLGDFRAYAARVVPAFKLTAYETRFRVFEERTLEEVLREVLRPYPEVELNTNALKEDPGPRIPYCVQFGESTFNFVHRMLDRFGLFYRFEHELNEKHEVMVLGSRRSVPRGNVGVFDIGAGEPAAGRVTAFRKSFALATRAARVGNFNEINPATPFRGRAEIAPAYDLMGGHPAHEAEAFPAPVTVAPEPKNYAELRMRQNEGGVFGVTGQAKDAHFRPGRTFIVHKDSTVPDDAPDKGETGKTFLLKTVTIFAFDHSALTSTGKRVVDTVLKLLGLGSGDSDDATSGAAQALLDQVRKDVESGKEIFAWLEKEAGAKNPSGLPDFVGNALGLGGSAIAGAVPLVVATAKAVKDVVEKFLAKPSGLSCAFEALPFDSPFLRDVLPTPAATRPVANGPHLALVVGPDGIDTSARDIFTDALGRVRIRFPWDPGPDDPDDPIGKEAILTGRNTCFVRVSDGWAGERLGLQFIPRIGQEVVVGFIDGDPERPMVVGRAYNARGGTSHLPFLPATAQGKQIATLADLKGTETEQATRSGIRSKTTPKKPEGQSGFHMMRLEDKQGEEQFLIRSERRMDITAFGSRFDSTRGNLHILVGGDRQEPGKPPPGGAMLTTAAGTHDLHVGKERYETMGSKWEAYAKGYKMSHIAGQWVTYAEQEAKVSAKSIVFQASDKITLHVGSSRIVITPASIYIHAAMVRENQGGPLDLIGDTEITEAADASVADPGEPPDFLARLPKGGGGGRRKHTVEAKRAFVVFRGPDKKIHVGNPDNPPGALTIDDRDPDFADRVATDLNNLAKTDEGMARINEANANTSRPVAIQKAPAPKPGDPPAQPSFVPKDIAGGTKAGEPTGRIDKDGNIERGTGAGSGGAAVYDPKDWPRPGDPDSPTSQEQLAGLLDRANESKNGNMPGNLFSGQVPPKPPPPSSPPPAAPASGGGPGPPPGGGPG